MTDEINRTHGSSPHDYATMIGHLSPKSLAEETQTNYWCWKHLQKQEINYGARYLACLALQLQRGHLDYIKSTT